ncbi:hypothetical protein [Demequina globuliformis]|uniref:hypothetical protein n=1 Tax=Demequina globuliformis TaxID=676202 RepID=UPI000783B008|nr:hypothetical protein [Demequina globuliformis]
MTVTMANPVHVDDVDDRLRALAFWVGHHQMSEPAPPIWPRRPASPVPPARASTDQRRAERVRELEALVPELLKMAATGGAHARTTVAKSFAILAQAGRGPADRQVWAALLTLASDPDPVVRGAADEALSACETYGTVPRRATSLRGTAH